MAGKVRETRSQLEVECDYYDKGFRDALKKAAEVCHELGTRQGQWSCVSRTALRLETEILKQEPAHGN